MMFCQVALISAPHLPIVAHALRIVSAERDHRDVDR
jgi:hypothetical protein